MSTCNCANRFWICMRVEKYCLQGLHLILIREQVLQSTQRQNNLQKCQNSEDNDQSLQFGIQHPKTDRTVTRTIINLLYQCKQNYGWA